MAKKIAWCIITDNEEDIISLKRFAERQKYLKSIYPILILLGQNLQKSEKLNLLKELDNTSIKFVPKLELDLEDRYKSTMMKATALLQDDYDLLCFIETDTIIKDNIDWLITNNINEIFTKSNDIIFLNDKYGWEAHHHIQGICFFIKPNKNTYVELTQYLTETTGSVDEVIWTNFYTQYKKLSIIDIILAQEDVFSLLMETIMHFPGPLKPWNKYFSNLREIYYNTSYIDFNNYINNNSSRLRLLEGFVRLYYHTNCNNSQLSFEETFINNGLPDIIYILNTLTSYFSTDEKFKKLIEQNFAEIKIINKLPQQIKETTISNTIENDQDNIVQEKTINLKYLRKVKEYNKKRKLC